VDSFAFTTNLGCLASAPAWVKITVSSVNDAPVLAAIGSKTVVKGKALTFIATATDPDAGQTRTFSLISAPSGATISATTGTFSWTPSVTGTFTFKVRVTDNGSPVLYDEETITVTVTATLVNTLANSAEADITATKLIEESPAATATLYPNPVTSDFTVTLKQPAASVLLTILDAKGSMVQVQSFKNTGLQLHVDAAQLKRGAYLVQLKTGEAVQTLKFVKQ
jgi:hypothetical protein